MSKVLRMLGVDTNKVSSYYIHENRDYEEWERTEVKLDDDKLIFIASMVTISILLSYMIARLP